MAVRRFDVGEDLDPPQRLPNGYLRVDAFLTRAGVFTYRRPDGSTVREYRSPEEVFRPDSIASFDLMPVTIEHPPVGLLDPSNTHQFQVGTVGHPQRAGSRMRGAILVTDAKAQKELDNGRRQISLGYTCDVEMTPGVSPEGEHYDAVQKKIVGNHCAIVQVGRAGADVCVRMDSGDAVMLLSPASEIPAGSAEEQKTVKRKIKLDGIEVEVDEAVALAIESSQARTDAAVKAAKADADKAIAESKVALDKANARADAAEAQIKTLQADLAAAPAKALAAAKARADLETSARSVLGADAKFDGMTDDQVRRAAVLKASGDDLKDRTPEYVAARFDAEIAFQARGNSGLAAIRAVTTPRADAVDPTVAAETAYLNALKGK